jgi:hypothetical protein
MTSSEAIVLLIPIGFMLFFISRRIDAALLAFKQKAETDLELRIENALHKAIDNFNSAKAKNEKKNEIFRRLNFGISL